MRDAKQELRHKLAQIERDAAEMVERAGELLREASRAVAHMDRGDAMGRLGVPSVDLGPLTNRIGRSIGAAHSLALVCYRDELEAKQRVVAELDEIEAFEMGERGT